MFFNPSEVLDKGFFLNFVLSERGAGKTFSTLKMRVQHFLNTGKQFVYMRRSETERDQSTPTLLSQLQAEGFFTNHKFRAHKDVITCDGKVCCHSLALSTAYKHKSTSFHDVDFIIFDEFIDENNRYLKNEVTKFLSFLETIGRMRDYRVICLANRITKYNPYFKYFNVQSSGSPFTRFRQQSILINEFKSEEYRSKKLETHFGRLIAGTEYGNYMLNNEAINDDYTYIDKLEGIKKIPIANMIIEKDNIVVYEAIGEDAWYMFFHTRKPIPDLKTINYDSMLVENSTLDVVKNAPLTRRIKINYKRGTVRFYDMQAKLAINELIFI